MLVRIDPASGIPLAEQIAGQIRGSIARGDTLPRERLPSARDLAGALDVNMHTVLRAYGDLRDEGLIELRRGRGAVVSADAVAGNVHVRELARDLLTAARRLGLGADDVITMVKEMDA